MGGRCCSGNHLTLRGSGFDFGLGVIVAESECGNTGFVKFQIAFAHRNIIVGVMDGSYDIGVNDIGVNASVSVTLVSDCSV